jgi:hypothetical protein
MERMHTVTRWLGVVALGVAGVALWRTESRATVPPETSSPTAHTRTTVPAVTQAPASPPVAPPTTVIATPPAPVVAAPAPAHLGALHVRRFVIARGVENRAPVEPGTSFHLESGDRLFAFIDAANGTGHGSEVQIDFEQGNTRVSEVTLNVPAQPRWRTWGFTRMVHRPGHFTAVVRTLDGRELARSEFDVT